MNLLENHVSLLYDILGHKGHWTQVHALDTKKRRTLDRSVINGKSALISWAKKWNGKANLFIGRNPRTSAGDVAVVTSLSFDIDPVRAKDTAATEAQHKEALDVARRIQKHLGEGVLASSGNGALLLFRAPSPVVGTSAMEQFARGAKTFETDIRRQFETARVVIDATHDNARMVKLVGSTSTKGEPRLWRNAKFFSFTTRKLALAPTVFEGITSHREAQRFDSAGPISAGAPKGLFDRSKADYSLVYSLYKAGASDDYILEYMRAHGTRGGRFDDHVMLLDKVKSLIGPHRGDGGGAGERSTEDTGLEIYGGEGSIDTYRERVKRRLSGNGEAELPTGIGSVDKHTGGFKRKDVWVIGARTGIGKTSLAINIAQHLIGRDKRVLFFSTEMSFEDIIDRFVSIETRIPAFSLTTGQLGGELSLHVEECLSQLQQKPLFICDRPEPTTGEIEAAIKRVKPDLVVFDHIQRAASKSDKTHTEISKFLKAFKNLCATYDCAGLITSQLNRMAEKEPPARHHLAESGTIEQEAAVVVLLTPLVAITDENLQHIPMLASIVKNRYGRCVNVELTFETTITKFKEN